MNSPIPNRLRSRTSCRKRTSPTDRLIRSRSAEKLRWSTLTGASPHADVPVRSTSKATDAVPTRLRISWSSIPRRSSSRAAFGIKQRPIALPVLGHGAGDRVVQASVQGAEVLDADGRVQLQREIGDGLTHIPVIVDDLRHRESLQMQIMACAQRSG